MARPDDEAAEHAREVWQAVRSHYSPQKYGPLFPVRAYDREEKQITYEFKIVMVGQNDYMVLWEGLVMERGKVDGSKW